MKYHVVFFDISSHTTHYRTTFLKILKFGYGGKNIIVMKYHVVLMRLILSTFIGAYIGPTSHWSDRLLVRRMTHWSDGPLVRRSNAPIIFKYQPCTHIISVTRHLVKEINLIEFWDFLNCLQGLHMKVLNRVIFIYGEVEIVIAVSKILISETIIL